MAAVLSNLGVGVGDRVLIYMPMITETIVAMLATIRIGAAHSVVFGGIDTFFLSVVLCIINSLLLNRLRRQRALDSHPPLPAESHPVCQLRR